MLFSGSGNPANVYRVTWRGSFKSCTNSKINNDDNDNNNRNNNYIQKNHIIILLCYLIRDGSVACSKSVFLQSADTYLPLTLIMLECNTIKIAELTPKRSSGLHNCENYEFTLVGNVMMGIFNGVIFCFSWRLRVYVKSKCFRCT